MKRLLTSFALASAMLMAEVPQNTAIRQGHVTLFIQQMTAQPIVNIPGTDANTDWRSIYLVSVADLPGLESDHVTIFRVSVTFTANGKKSTVAHLMFRYSEPAAQAIPNFAFYKLSADAVIDSVLVEELATVASEQF